MVLLSALRRLAVLVVLGSVLIALVSLPLGLLAGSSSLRALTLGFYLAGCFLMVVGFFTGNRGPARVKSESAGAAILPFTFSGRRLRWASFGEQNETINKSAIFVTLGLLFVLIGLLIDPNHALF
jgi:hypothetical protein